MTTPQTLTIRSFSDRAEALSHFILRAGEAPRLVAFDDTIGCPMEIALAALEWTGATGVLPDDDMIHAARLTSETAAAVIERKVEGRRQYIYLGPRLDAPPMDVFEGKVLFDQTQALGVTQMIVWTARKSFIEKNRAAMVDFMEDMLVITRWFQDPKNKDEVTKIASKITKVPPERFGWLFTKQDTYRDPNLIPNVEALQRNVDVTRDLGFVKKPIDIKKYVDLSLAQEAAKRLK